MDDPADVRRLRWRCRRGMKELDVLLERYLTREYIEADAARRSAFAKLLELQDPQLHAYLLDGVLAPDPAIRDVVRSITRSAP